MEQNTESRNQSAHARRCGNIRVSREWANVLFNKRCYENWLSIRGRISTLQQSQNLI